jgi:hypothetical protein
MRMQLHWCLFWMFGHDGHQPIRCFVCVLLLISSLCSYRQCRAGTWLPPGDSYICGRKPWPCKVQTHSSQLGWHCACGRVAETISTCHHQDVNNKTSYALVDPRNIPWSPEASKNRHIYTTQWYCSRDQDRLAQSISSINHRYTPRRWGLRISLFCWFLCSLIYRNFVCHGRFLHRPYRVTERSWGYGTDTVYTETVCHRIYYGRNRNRTAQYLILFLNPWPRLSFLNLSTFESIQLRELMSSCVKPARFVPFNQ